MFLRNWYKMLGTAFSETGMKAVNQDGGEITLTDSFSNTSNFSAINLGDYLKQFVSLSTSATNSAGVIFGTGSVPPSLDDYKLSGTKVYGNLSATCALSGTDDGSGITVKAVYTITNSDTSEVVIREIAVVAYNGGKNYLVERTVLDSPVTIQPNGVGQVNYIIRINYPT